MAKVMLHGARLSFAQGLFKATSVAGQGDPRYSATFLIEPGSANEKAVRAAITAAATEKWKDKAKGILISLEKTGKIALHDGAEKPNYDGFEGMLFVAAASKASSRPTVVDRNKAPLTEEDGVIYSGCYVNASIEFWAQDNSYGKRVNAQLRGVQFVRDGDAFSAGRPASADEFDDLGDEEGTDDLA